MDGPYVSYQVLDKWDSLSFDGTTRTVLARRLQAVPTRRFFSEAEWRVLEAAVAGLLPQPERLCPVPITPWIDAQLHEGIQEGFRYAAMPPVRETWQRGLAALDAEARRREGRGLDQLDAHARDATLRAVERGEVDPSLWQGLDPRCFFVLVLTKTVAGIYYAHPAAWSEIGFGGPASPRGYVRLGPNQRDPWEAKEQSWNPR